MQTQSLRLRAGTILLLPLLTLAASCGERVTAVQTFPSSADLEAVTQPKPRPTPDIVTDPQANARYGAVIESDDDQRKAAGERICTWAILTGDKLPFACDRP